MSEPTHTRYQQVRHALEDLIEQRHIHLHYQAQNRLATHELIGLEALSRLHTPELGQVSPDEFIPVAEETGLIAPLERLVLEQVAQDLPQLSRLYPHVRLGVNISVRHITSPHFIAMMQTWLDQLPPNTAQRIDLEITETCFHLFTAQDMDGLQQLRQRGLRILMDDFGTGQSSLSRLHTLPFDGIKLDKQFAQQIDHPMVYAIVKAAIDFAQQFNIDLIVEGVETLHQCEVLRHIGCQTVQGFYFGRPAPLAHWLAPHTA